MNRLMNVFMHRNQQMNRDPTSLYLWCIGVLPPPKVKVFLSVGPCSGNSAIYHSYDLNFFLEKKKCQVSAPRFGPKISGRQAETLPLS